MTGHPTTPPTLLVASLAEWEYENYPEGELQKMVELYVSKGLEEQDAKGTCSTDATVARGGNDSMHSPNTCPWKKGLAEAAEPSPPQSPSPVLGVVGGRPERYAL